MFGAAFRGGAERSPRAVGADPWVYGASAARSLGANGGSAEALAPAVAVMRRETDHPRRGHRPEHAVAPAALVEAVLAALGV